jgi:hypothetical protein
MTRRSRIHTCTNERQIKPSNQYFGTVTELYETPLHAENPVQSVVPKASEQTKRLLVQRNPFVFDESQGQIHIFYRDEISQGRV